MTQRKQIETRMAAEGVAAGSGALDNLPEWDLSDLYPAQDSPQLRDDLAESDRAAQAFAARYEGKLAALSGDELAEAVIEFERFGEIMGRIISYASLHYAGNIADGERARFYQSMQEQLTQTQTHSLFFTLELNRLEEEEIEAKLAGSAKLERYRPWLRDLRAFRPHQLSDEVEKLLMERDVVGNSAWTRLFDETLARLRFPVGGRDLSSAEALNLLSDTNPEVRREAAKSLGKVFQDNIALFSLITNTLVKEKEIDDKWRKFPRSTSYRNLSNHVEDDVVEALAEAVRSSYGELSHRYYRLKAKWFGVEKLNHWDRNAPLPDDDDRFYGWDEARDIVLAAYGRFSPDLAKIGQRFFDNPWIDVPTRPGKSPGAFAHSTVPSVHPYLLLNYLGKSRDIMTLAHELGHGVHQVLAADQGNLLSHTPLTLAETASVFGEMLTFRSLLDQETDPKRRRTLLASKVEDMINTVVRQIAFFTFEEKIHAERRTGELSPERLGEIWLEVQRESLGDAFTFDPEYSSYWTYIGHFIHSPFYVYAYAFGDCLVNSLYDVYRQGEPGFAAKYLEMLKAGGTKRHKELLAPFGLDATDPAFWKRGLSVLKGFIDELEALG